MRSVLSFALCVVGLAGCGGSSTSTVSGFELIDEFSDGSGVVRAEAGTHEFILKGNAVEGATPEDLPSFDMAGVTPFEVIGGRYYIPAPTNSPFALRSYVETTNGQAGFFTAGANGDILGTRGIAFGQLPDGTATLIGVASFLDNSDVTPVSAGGFFELTVDFDAQTASLDAQAAGYAFLADTMVIDPSKGEFGTDSATLDVTGDPTVSATFLGQFHGDATAVSGLGYDNGDTPGISLVIAGE